MKNRNHVILLFVVAGLFLLAAYSHTFTFVSASSPPPDPSAGCAAFPITVHEGVRSATLPGQGNIAFPDATDFDYPTNLPADYYNQFISHTPDTPLLFASAGDVFLVQNGFGFGHFGWLVWNEYVNSSSTTLAASLTWPGNSQDYTTIAAGQTPPGFAHPVYGFIEAGDPSDTSMHIGDWVAASTGSVGASGLRNALNALIDDGRVLRLPVWVEAVGLGSNGRYLISHFALFRIVGYNLDQSQSYSWLLLEFMGFDESCGQNGQPAAGDPVLHIKAVARSADVVVGWMPNRFLEAETYRLLKADNGGLFAELVVTSANQYADAEVDAGNTYCYQTQALDGNMNLIVASEIRCVAIAP